MTLLESLFTPPQDDANIIPASVQIYITAADRFALYFFLTH